MLSRKFLYFKGENILQKYFLKCAMCNILVFVSKPLVWTLAPGLKSRSQTRCSVAFSLSKRAVFESLTKTTIYCIHFTPSLSFLHTPTFTPDLRAGAQSIRGSEFKQPFTNEFTQNFKWKFLQIYLILLFLIVLFLPLILFIYENVL